MTLLALLVLSQYVAPCGPSASCYRVGASSSTIELGAVKTVPYATPDGGSPQARLLSTTSSTPIAVLGSQSRTSTQPDVIIGGLNARDGGQGPIVSFRTGGYEVATVTSNGTTINGTLQASGPSGLGRVTTVQALDAGLYSKVGGVTIGGELAQDGGVASHFCQHGYGAMTAGELAVTYTRAFTSNSSCICSHTQTTNANACGIKTGTAPSTTAVTFAVASGDTDVVFWICCGDI